MPRKIVAVTGSRADWGLLAPLLACLRDDQDFDLRLVVTGQHLAASGQDSREAILAEGFAPAAEVDMRLCNDQAPTVTTGLGIATSALGEVLERERPDYALVLGDRYEIVAPAAAALLAGVPLIHLCGGDVTEGAIDDSIRHAVTKLAHLHFVTTSQAAARVLQLGEEPWRVHVVGSTGIDRLLSMPRMDRKAFFSSISLTPRSRNALVTFHPETLADDIAGQCDALLSALAGLGEDIGLIFTGTNADPGGVAIQQRIEAFAEGHANAVFVQSLGSERYCAALEQVDVVIGNSSSGLYEAPSFRVPSVNIGERQAGRVRAASVVDCSTTPQAIKRAVRSALALDCSDVVNPYGDGHASERIVEILRGTDNPRALLKKRFVSRIEIPTMNGRVYIIAEAGVNHDGSLENALSLVQAAADAGADAGKVPDLQRRASGDTSGTEGGLSATRRRIRESV